MNVVFRSNCAFTTVQLAFDPIRALHELRVDPNSRCAALTLPQDALAILPFFESQTDLDIDMDQNNMTR